MILLIDNYDSFVHNLARYFQRLKQVTRVVRNDRITVREIEAMRPLAIVLSPGPCTPSEAGVSLELVQSLHSLVPMLGVCLGHQAIVQALGGRIVRAAQPMHGRESLVWHDGRQEFAGLPNPMRVGRYHSLIVDRASLPDSLAVTAATDDQTIMGIRHQQYPVFGIQFHPESILTECGFALLRNFLRLAGARLEAPSPSIDSERPVRETTAWNAPTAPVTF